MGATVDHEMQLRSEDDATVQSGEQVEAGVVRACEGFLASAVPKLVDALATKFQDVLTAQARAQQDARAQMQAATWQLSSVRPVVNINSSPRGGQDALKQIRGGGLKLDAPKDDAAAARIRSTAANGGVPWSLRTFLRSCWQLQWRRAGVRHTAVVAQFGILMKA